MSSKYTGKAAATSPMTTELNSLGDASNKLSSALSNDAATTERNLFADFSLSIATQGSNRDTGATVRLYVLPEVDGEYAYGGDSLDPSPAHYRGSFHFDAATAARVDIIEGVKIPNGDYKILLINNTGQAFAASGNVLKCEIYSGYEDV
jgi:hypothetical protein